MIDPNNNPKILSKIGKVVAKNLDRNKRVQKIPNDHLQFYVYQNFLNLEERSNLIELIDRAAKPSLLYAGTELEGFRTSYSCNLDPYHPHVMSIDTKISKLLGVKPGYSEIIQGQRYDVGQEFKEHHDFFHTTESYWQKERENGGQRSWTAMIYLNDDLEGGTTEFHKAQIGVRPLAGMLVAWNNMKPDGTQNDFSLHAGKPVTKGRKYIITKWFRQKKWALR